MNNNTKTLIFVGAALVVGGVAFVTRPQPPGISPDAELDTKLYKNFEDPLAVHSLEIVKYDKDTFAITEFKVSQVDGVWSLPNHENYPADAKDQVADAATSVMDLKILGIATDKASEHELYGVVEPDLEKIKVESAGIGTLVTMKDAEGNNLARMIFGKKVPDNEELRYVRKSGQDRVYTVKVDTSKLTTKFGDWIEEDLLKLDPFDVKRVTLNDYAIVNVRDSTGRITKEIHERSAMTFAFEDSKWKLEELKQPDKEEKLVSVEPAEDEEPDTTTLDDLKNALDDLKIADVERKPKKLADGLKSTGELRPTDQDGLLALVERGFFAQEYEGKLQVFSDAGEVIVGMKDGVEYALNFGVISGGGESNSDDIDSDGEDSESESKSPNLGLNRYILVTTRFNADLVPKPDIKPLPPVEAIKGNEKPPVEAKKPNGEEQSNQAQASANSDIENKESEKDAERKRIEEQNERAREDYEKKLDEGREKVRKLNYRFADWFFVISEDVYEKIHLSKADVLKKKDAEKSDGSNTGGTLPNFNFPGN